MGKAPGVRNLTRGEIFLPVAAQARATREELVRRGVNANVCEEILVIEQRAWELLQQYLSDTQDEKYPQSEQHIAVVAFSCWRRAVEEIKHR
jgi:hypothetical protein